MTIFDISRFCSDNGLDHYAANVSLWDPDEEYKGFMRDVMKLDFHEVEFKYVYSYDFDGNVQTGVFEKLGIGRIREGCSLGQMYTPSGMIALENILRHVMVRFGKRRLFIANPSYFALPYCCEKIGMSYEYVSLERKDGYYFTPEDLKKILDSEDGLVILTSPIFSQGGRFSDLLVSQIQELIDGDVFCVFDECATPNGSELCRRLVSSERTFYVYETHKIFALNDVKAAIVLGEPESLGEIDSHIQFSVGPLNYSTKMAIFHYISENYGKCLRCLEDFILERVRFLKREFGNMVDYGGVGTYAMVHTDIAYGGLGLERTVEDIVGKTGYAFIPSSMHTFEMKEYLSFRVNLLMDREKLLESISRIGSYRS